MEISFKLLKHNFTHKLLKRQINLHHFHYFNQKGAKNKLKNINPLKKKNNNIPFSKAFTSFVLSSKNVNFLGEIMLVRKFFFSSC